MKYLYIILSMTSLMWLASGCSNDKGEDYDPQHNEEHKNKPQWVAQAAHTVSQSPAWQATEGLERYGSMTATVAVDTAMVAIVSDEDMVAAFCDGECLGVARPNYSSAHGCRFFLYIRQPEGENQEVTLAYYSEKDSKAYYWINRLPFVTDSKKGSTAEPLLLSAEGESGGYMYKSNVVLSLPESLSLKLGGDDMLALFAGDDCRVCVTNEDKMNEGNTFILFVPMKSATEQFTLRLYSGRDDRIYTSDVYTITALDANTISDVTLK